MEFFLMISFSRSVLSIWAWIQGQFYLTDTSYLCSKTRMLPNTHTFGFMASRSLSDTFHGLSLLSSCTSPPACSSYSLKGAMVSSYRCKLQEQRGRKHQQLLKTCMFLYACPWACLCPFLTFSLEEVYPHLLLLRRPQSPAGISLKASSCWNKKHADLNAYKN